MRLNKIFKFNMVEIIQSKNNVVNVLEDLKGQVEQLLILLSERERYVIESRFALKNSDKMTLEQIGQHYSVTRERIRQIENNALVKLKRNINNTLLSNINNHAYSLLIENGGLMNEEILISSLNDGDKKYNPSALIFILSLDNRFIKKPNTINYLPYFRLNDFSDELIDKIVKESFALLSKNKDVLSFKELLSAIKPLDSSFEVTSESMIKSVTQIHKSFKVIDNKVGLKSWKHIHPKTLRDKIFFVLRKSEKPMHFVDISNAISNNRFDNKSVNLQAVHNELIRFEEFILIGRGIYALREWGYESGTVKDVIERILKKHGVLSEEQVIEKVLENRNVKKITILLNLKNSENFTRVGRKMYSLKK